jgi:SAM-dependent methyltransferase/3-polyprenyl-4-hydroxybenzoate decarboxylase
MSIVRAETARVVEVGDGVCLVGADGTIARVDGDSAAVVRRVLDLIARPIARDAVALAISREAGADAGPIVDQILELLRATGAARIAEAAPVAASEAPGVAPRGPSAGLRAGNIVVGVTGAIAAVHAPSLVLALQRRGFAVEVAMSRASRRFVAPAALGAIAQREVHRSLWPATPLAPVPHVALAAWADLVVIYPASATTIARLAHGEFSDLVAAIALTTRAPVIAAPSMNPAMAEAPAVQRNLDQLRADGIALLAPVPAVEVAEAPEARAPVGGGCPPPGEVAATIDALVRANALPRRAPRARVPTDAAGWDATYAAPGAADDGRLPWVTDDCDADLAAALAAHGKPPGPLLDVGTGLGQVARHAAGAGYHVVATDVSDAALALARGRGGGEGIVWLRDDIAASALAGSFAVVVDRACLHVLPRARHAAWAAAMRRLVAPGGVLLVKTHQPGAPYATAAFTRDGLAALVGDGFEAVSIEPSTIPGARVATPAPAWLGVFRRAVARVHAV